jgi:hypothetical protein
LHEHRFTFYLEQNQQNENEKEKEKGKENEDMSCDRRGERSSGRLHEFSVEDGGDWASI